MIDFKALNGPETLKGSYSFPGYIGPTYEKEAKGELFLGKALHWETGYGVTLVFMKECKYNTLFAFFCAVLANKNYPALNDSNMFKGV